MTAEPGIGPGMVRVMCDELRALGFEVERPKAPEVSVSNLERMSADEYRGDVDLHLPRWGRVVVRRVYLQMGTDGLQTWMLKWPRRHKEGSPLGWGQEWVVTASMTGRFADLALEAMVEAVRSAVSSAVKEPTDG